MSANDDLMMQFVEMTGSDPDTALYFLEISNFDLESALNLIYSGDIPPPSSNKKTTESIHQENDPFPTFEDDEDSIRVADPVRQQVLLDYTSQSQSQSQRIAMQNNLAFSRAEDSSVEWMFPPPTHLSFPGTLAEARATAMRDQKWILVNIQCDKEFSSHLLNRDVWTNETLVSLLRMNFIFWQRGKTSQDGEMFASMHRLASEFGGSGFPMIGIVDSRTGALISEIQVTKNTDGNDLILKLMEFLEANHLSDVQAPTVRPRTSSKSSSKPSPEDRKTSEEEEEDDDDEDDILSLAAALKASMDLPPPPQVQDSVASLSNEKESDTVSSESTSPSLYANITLAETAEPQDGAEGIKVSLKLAPELMHAIASTSTTGKTANSLVRSFHTEQHTVQHVYAAVHFLLQTHAEALSPACRGRPFDLLTAFPRLSLDGKRDLSVNAAGLKGAQVIMQWL